MRRRAHDACLHAQRRESENIAVEAPPGQAAVQRAHLRCPLTMRSGEASDVNRPPAS